MGFLDEHEFMASIIKPAVNMEHHSGKFIKASRGIAFLVSV